MSQVKTTAYLCVQGWGEENSGVSVGPIESLDSGATIVTNPDAAASQNLGDYTILEGTTITTDLECAVDVSMNPLDSSLDGLYTIGIIGVRVKPLTEDIVVRCTMTVDSVEYQSAATIYGLDMERDLPVGTEGHTLFGSGISNFIFHDLPASVFQSTISFRFTVDGSAGDFANAQLYIGNIFAGLQIPLSVDRESMTMGFEAVNDRDMTRGGNNISSDGILKRSIQFQAKQMSIEDVTGIRSGYYSGDSLGANMMRAAISNMGQPMLLSFWPYPVNEQAWSDSPGAAEIRARNLSRRQNFFAIYGLLDRQLDIVADEAIANGDLSNMLFRVRLRFGETR